MPIKIITLSENTAARVNLLAKFNNAGTRINL
jgi:hypothetical protein